MTKSITDSNVADNEARGRYAPVNGLDMYYEVHGTGKPLVLLHGGLMTIEGMGQVLTPLAETRQIIAVELQGHGHTADIDRPLSIELMADDIAALIEHLGFDKVTILGYSLGGGVALRTAIQHPEVVDRLVLISVPFRRDGWYPEVLAGMEQMSGAAAEAMKPSPMYQSYAAVAPRPENFPVLLDKMGDLLRQEYDWSSDVASLKMPAMIVFGDADAVRPMHAVEFFELLGGGQRDAGWDGSGMSNARLAILPGVTHYDICSSPMPAAVVTPFLEAATLAAS